MNMHILSDSQHQELTHALKKVQAILDSSTSVVLDSAAPTITKPTAKSQVKTPKSSHKGRRGVSVLNDAKVLEIKRQLASGTKSVAKIASQFGVHVTTINCIKWGKTWKHVQLQQDTAPASAKA
jgi:hypothetical protein